MRSCARRLRAGQRARMRCRVSRIRLEWRSARGLARGTHAMAATIIGLIVLVVILWDVFETIILPRRVTRRFRIVRMFYRYTWIPWRGAARVIRRGSRRESFLSYFGPLSLLALFVVWALGDRKST